MEQRASRRAAASYSCFELAHVRERAKEMIAERGMRTSLTPIFDKFFLRGAHAVFEPRSPSLRDLLLPLLQLVSESDSLRADSLGYWRSGGDLFFLPRFVFQLS